MANETTCLKCGAPLAGDARQGFCPKCLFAQASTGEFDNAAVASQSGPPNALGVGESSSTDRASVSTTEGQELPRTFGDYELLEEVARGGMGIVYRAQQVSLDRMVAVKMLLFGPLSSPEFVKRFRAEASAAASLLHPNIVAIHEVGVHQGQQFFAMDYVEGPSLAKLLTNGPMSPRRAASYLKTIAEAIHYAHERGILHRDLKPSNVLIDANDQPRVTDFGLARRLEGDSELTVTGQVLGSPNYMPPEQATAKRGKVSRRSDVYSLGAMLYHLLAGRPPFVGEALTDTLEQVLNAEPVSPRLLNPSVPRDLETICLKCLEKEPGKRYATAQALADELGRFLDNEPVHARPVTRAERVWRWCRRKPALAGLVVALLLVFALGLAGVFWQWRRAELNATHEANERERAEQESLKARQIAYASDMLVANQAVKDGDFFRAQQRLDAHGPAVGVPATAGSAPDSRVAHQDRLKAEFQTDLRGWEWRYLWKQSQGEQLFILGYHSNGVTAVGFLRDGKTVCSAGMDGAVRLWDLESRHPIGLMPYSEKINGAAASPDGRWLATAASTRAQKDPLCLWDLATRQLVAVLTTNFWLRQSSITFSPDSKWLAFASYARVHLWDVNARSEITNLPATYQQLNPLGVAFSPDNRILAFNKDEYGTILLWDISRHSLAGQLEGHESYVKALAFSPDSKTLASGGQDRTVRLWNLAERRERSRFSNDTDIQTLAFSRDGTLALGCADSKIRLLALGTGLQTDELRGHRKTITSLAFSPDGRTLLSASFDGTIRAWDAAPHPREKFSRDFAEDLERAVSSYGPALGLSPDGRHLLAAYTNGTFSVWDTLRLTESQRYPLCFTNTSVAALAPGGKLAGFSSENGEVMLWDAQTGKTRFFARPESNGIHRLVFSLDGHQLAAASEKTIRAWDVATQKETATFSTEEDTVMSLAFSSNGQALMAGFFTGPVKLWQIGGPSQAATFLGHNEPVRGLALLPGGRTLVSAGGPDIRFWDIQTRREKRKLSPRQNWFFCGALSADGRRFAAGAGDGLITIWDVASHLEVATLRGHKERVMHLAFTPNGDCLVSASRDQLRVWRAAPFEETDQDRHNK